MTEREIREQERRRCVGIVLKHVGLHQLSGRQQIARALDVVATEMEHGLTIADEAEPCEALRHP